MIGLAAVQIAKTLGGFVIAAAGTASKTRDCKKKKIWSRSAC